MKKKSLLLVLFLLFCFGAHAQDKPFPENANGDPEFSEIVESPLLKASLYANAKAWVMETFNNYKAVVQYESDTEGKLVIKSQYENFRPKLIEDDFSGFWYERVYYTITIDCKDNKYRYKINDISIKSIHYSHGHDYVSTVYHDNHLGNKEKYALERDGYLQKIEEAKATLKGKKLEKELASLNASLKKIEERIAFENDIYYAEYEFFDGLGLSIKKRMAINDDF